MALDRGFHWNRDSANSRDLEIRMAPVFTQLEGSLHRALNCSHPSDHNQRPKQFFPPEFARSQPTEGGPRRNGRVVIHN
jgi:hypothetical protein